MEHPQDTGNLNDSKANINEKQKKGAQNPHL